MQKRLSPNRNVSVGDIVLIVKVSFRSQWPFAIVEATLLDLNGNFTYVTIHIQQIKAGIYVMLENARSRPNKLYL